MKPLLHTEVGLALGALGVLAAGAVAVAIWKLLGDITEACRWGR